MSKVLINGCSRGIGYDTAMATTHLPKSAPGTVYPHGRRLRAFFLNLDKPEAPADLVSEKIRQVIEGDADYNRRVLQDTGVDLHLD